MAFDTANMLDLDSPPAAAAPGTTYRYQVACGGVGGEWMTYREFDTLRALANFARSDEARILCWGRGFRWLAPGDSVIDHMVTDY